MVLIWLPPCIIDRVKHASPGICMWDPGKNPEAVVLVSVVGYHIPTIVMTFCYLRYSSYLNKHSTSLKVNQDIKMSHEGTIFILLGLYS